MNPATDEATKTTAKLALAQQLFKEYYAACFWHYDPNLVISEAMLPLIIKDLKHHGGHRGWMAATKLAE